MILDKIQCNNKSVGILKWDSEKKLVLKAWRSIACIVKSEWVMLLFLFSGRKKTKANPDKHKDARYIPFNFEMILIRIERLLTDTYSTVAAVFSLSHIDFRLSSHSFFLLSYPFISCYFFPLFVFKRYCF